MAEFQAGLSYNATDVPSPCEPDGVPQRTFLRGSDGAAAQSRFRAVTTLATLGAGLRFESFRECLGICKSSFGLALRKRQLHVRSRDWRHH